MYLDESNYILENDFKRPTKTILSANKNWRIVKEKTSASGTSIVTIGFLLSMLFLIASGWYSMIQPMVLNG